VCVVVVVVDARAFEGTVDGDLLVLRAAAMAVRVGVGEETTL